jgi:hypothetical protein
MSIDPSTLDHSIWTYISKKSEQLKKQDKEEKLIISGNNRGENTPRLASILLIFNYSIWSD